MVVKDTRYDSTPATTASRTRTKESLSCIRINSRTACNRRPCSDNYFRARRRYYMPRVYSGSLAGLWDLYGRRTNPLLDRRRYITLLGSTGGSARRNEGTDGGKVRGRERLGREGSRWSWPDHRSVHGGHSKQSDRFLFTGGHSLFSRGHFADNDGILAASKQNK